jgi:hypothetical protein
MFYVHFQKLYLELDFWLFKKIWKEQILECVQGVNFYFFFHHKIIDLAPNYVWGRIFFTYQDFQFH